MTAKITYILTSLVISWCVLSVAHGQDFPQSLDGDEEELETIDLPRYQVEIIVFRNLDPLSIGDESFEVIIELETPAEEPMVETAEESDIMVAPVTAMEFGDIEPVGDDEFDDDEVPVPPGFYELNDELFPHFEPQPDEKMQLTEMATTLAEREDYQSLLHLAWTQYGYPRDDSQPYEVVNMPLYVAGLAGSVTLSLGRFLHLDINLVLEPTAFEESGLEREEWERFALDTVPMRDTEDYAPHTKTIFTLQEQRRIRSNVIHYFDHPHLGVIALVTPWEPEEDEPNDEDFLEPSNPVAKSGNRNTRTAY